MINFPKELLPIKLKLIKLASTFSKIHPVLHFEDMLQVAMIGAMKDIDRSYLFAHSAVIDEIRKFAGRSLETQEIKRRMSNYIQWEILNNASCFSYKPLEGTDFLALESLRESIFKLKTRRRFVIECILNGDKETEIAKKIGVSNIRVGQIKRAAIIDLRSLMKDRHFP